MPKVYLTAADRKAAEEKKAFAAQDYALTHALHNKMRDDKVTLDELAERSGVSRPSIQKALKTPEKMKAEMLRQIFSAAGLQLIIICK